MNRYRDARLRAGLSQKEAAISIGVKPPSMSDWENGKSQPTQKHLVSMAALYGTTTDYLTGASDLEKQAAPETGKDMKEAVIASIISLPDSAVTRVSDFIEGLKVGKDIK